MSNLISESEYNSYYNRYVELAISFPLLEGLTSGLNATKNFFEAIPESKLNYQYAAGKWTPKEILLHIIDTERVFAYRALQFARASNVVIKGFNQDEFAANYNVASRSISSLLEEFESVRTATIHLFQSFDEKTLLRMGIASDSPLSVRASGYIICGHEKHHCRIITERYL